MFKEPSEWFLYCIKMNGLGRNEASLCYTFSSSNCSTPLFPPLLLSIGRIRSTSNGLRQTTDTTDRLKQQKSEAEDRNKGAQHIHPLFTKFFVCGCESVAPSCVCSLESVCPHQRSFDGMKWKRSVGQCENIHTHAGVELAQRDVNKWAAFMLTPEAAAVSVHL